MSNWRIKVSTSGKLASIVRADVRSEDVTETVTHPEQGIIIDQLADGRIAGFGITSDAPVEIVFGTES